MLIISQRCLNISRVYIDISDDINHLIRSFDENICMVELYLNYKKTQLCIINKFVEMDHNHLKLAYEC